ncbi:hypothetical protein [Occallatibacter riparius]|uniref:Uncharacterized protein n=1 Tax=Occallatibacter riparius TaxID=1002689 RepID=A0A9J7BT24_9BACT|nr:hypothetical protein [Occallatibacter riparius]UWZ84054.1 hypothetical protein MOP44_26290 [Occallatibacter riparius]
MGADERPILDWVNLPEGADELSLWSTLHDGDLAAIESDLLARTLTLRFDVSYVRDFHKLSEETLFVVTVSGVQSVRSFSNIPWPGGCSIPSGTSYEQQQAITVEYQRKWREQSLSWAEFERLTDTGLEVSSATLARRSDCASLHLGLLVGGDSYVEAYVRGDAITFSIGERQLTPEEFVELGEAYWDAFAKKR